ncbi:hypothetical protein DFH11DRAFT_232120 [Phellopilus nigrolimitatus]|nr:hypothetical protein DFH11DRAFT_232120 [Phellopilus nigrolimitatus]
MLSIRSDVESVGLSVASIIYSEVFQEMYGQLVISTILIYDTIITMDKEVQYFWSSPRKFVSLIYFLNRYVGVFSALSSPFYDTFRASNTLPIFVLVY